MSINYNRNLHSPKRDYKKDNTVNQVSGWRPYSPSLKTPHNNTALSQLYNTPNSNSVRVAQGVPSGPIGCDVSFTEGCDFGVNYVILEWDYLHLQNIETSINGGPWVNHGCGALSPMTNNTVTQGDTIQARGVCSVSINHDGAAECGTSEIASNTNIYVFYDVTSMVYATAQNFRDAIEDWAANNIANYEGNIYHIPVMHERWILWVQYPLTGILPPYYQLSQFSPIDMQQYNSFWDGSGYTNNNGTTMPIGNPGPKNSSGSRKRVPWAGPLVVGETLDDYNQTLPDANGTPGAGSQLLQGTGSCNMGEYGRANWSYRKGGVLPFINLPKAGDIIPNFQGSGSDHIITLAEAADLTDIKSGEWLNNTTGGECDAGGSRAQFVGGDVDALVICLSDETVHGVGWEQKTDAGLKMAESSLSGFWEGYHGRTGNGDHTKLTAEFHMAGSTPTVNDSLAISEAKSHYYVVCFGNGGRFRHHDGATNLCTWSSNPSKTYKPNSGTPGYSDNEFSGDFYVGAYDWENAIAGTFFKPSLSHPQGDIFLHFRDANFSDYPSNGWYDQWATGVYDVEVFCGQNWCPGASNGWESGSCNFEVLSQPTPGYIADFKYHLENIYPIIQNADAASSNGCKFSTFFYVVTNDNTNNARTGNSLCTVAALEGTTIGTFDQYKTYNNAAGIATYFPDTNNGGSMPRTAGGDISIDALGFFNPYGYEDNTGKPIYWHPDNDPGVGFDIKNHSHFKPSVGPNNIPGYGFKWYAKGSAGKCGYNIRRGSGVTDENINSDLNDFIAGGGISCDGQDCLLFTVVDNTGNPIPNYTFDFNNTNVTTDNNGEYGTQVNPGVYTFLCGYHMFNTSPSTWINGSTPDHTDMTVADPNTQANIYGCNAWNITITVDTFNTTLTQNCKLGCTDGTGLSNPVGSSAACNYDPTAGVDDGSCIYADCSDMCPDPSIINYTAYSGLGIYPSGASSVFPFAFQPGGGDAYYSPQCPNCCVGGNTGVLPSDCVDCLGVCGGSATYDECGVCDGPGPDECGVCFGDGTCCVGCTNPLAINYDPTATIDCEECCEIPDYACLIKELAIRILDSCPEDCDDSLKEMYNEAFTLYYSLGFVDQASDITDIEVNSIIKKLHRLLSKVECGNCCK